MEQAIDTQNKTFKHELTASIRKAVIQLQEKQKEEAVGLEEITDKVRQILVSKADTEDLN